MYKTIQARSNYRIDRIGPNGRLDLGSNCDGKVDVCLKNGSYHKIAFGGFLDTTNLVCLKRVKVMFITGLCIDDEAKDVRCTIPSDHYVVGSIVDNRVFLLLYDGEVKHYRLKHLDREHKNNVVNLTF